MRNAVVAYSKGRLIGGNNNIPWLGQLPADMRHFRRLTLEHPVIMGRLTFESIGKPLPRRVNIVISRSILEIAGCVVVPSLDDAFNVTDNFPEQDSFVIGGAKVYAEAMPYLDRLFVTEIDAEFEGDTFFPDISDRDWAITDAVSHEADQENSFNYRFLTYQRVEV